MAKELGHRQGRTGRTVAGAVAEKNSDRKVNNSDGQEKSSDMERKNSDATERNTTQH